LGSGALVVVAAGSGGTGGTGCSVSAGGAHAEGVDRLGSLLDNLLGCIAGGRFSDARLAAGDALGVVTPGFGLPLLAMSSAEAALLLLGRIFSLGFGGLVVGLGGLVVFGFGGLVVAGLGGCGVL